MDLDEICKRIVGNKKYKLSCDMYYQAGRKLADIAGIMRRDNDGYARASKLYEMTDVLDLLVKNRLAANTEEAVEIARYMLYHYIGNTTLDKVKAGEGVFYYFDELTARFLRLIDEMNMDEMKKVDE